MQIFAAYDIILGIGGIFMEDILVIDKLTKRYGSLCALDNFSINIPKGKIIGILGPNGSGKTTLIKIIANLLMQYEGSVKINGLTPGVETKKIVSYLPDANFLPDSWRVEDAIFYYKTFFADFDSEKAKNLVQQLNIDPKKRIGTLSKGNQEKIHLILVLSRNAELYIFDEPIAGVDPAARDLIFKLILENYNKQGTILLSTHLVLEAEKIFDYAAFLNNGRLALFDTVENIRNMTGKSLDELFREMYSYV